MLRVPAVIPAATGLKITKIVQLSPALTVLPQVWVWVKCPLTVMPEIVSEAPPVLVSVTAWGLLLVPTTAAKPSGEGDKLTSGPETRGGMLSVVWIVSAILSSVEAITGGTMSVVWIVS
jgi:hypothetical protein